MMLRGKIRVYCREYLKDYLKSDNSERRRLREDFQIEEKMHRKGIVGYLFSYRKVGDWGNMPNEGRGSGRKSFVH